MKKTLLFFALMLCLATSAQINPNVSPYRACDENYDGLANINLTSKISEILGNENPMDYTISFFTNPVSAEAGSPAISNPQNYTAVNGVFLWARVVKISTSQVTVLMLNVQVTPKPIVNTVIVERCNVAAGIAEFNLNEIRTQTYSEGQMAPGTTMSFYATLAAALTDSNPITNNIYTSASTTLYVRAATTGLDCYTIGNVELIAGNCVIPGQPVTLFSCLQSGTACFDLSANTSAILGANAFQEHSVSYHSTLVNAQNNVAPLPLSYCTATQQQVYARLTHNTSGLYAVTSFTLTPATVLANTGTPFATLTQCDNNADLLVMFDFTQYAAGSQFFTTESGAVSGVGPITNIASYTVSVSTPVSFIYRRQSGNACDLVEKIQLNAYANCNNSYTCTEARSLCGALGTPFSNIQGVPNAGTGNYACLATTPNPAWFYLPVSVGGPLNIKIQQFSLTGLPLDVDFILYGPFDNFSQACSGLTAANQLACSYSPDAVETFSLNTVANKYYLLMVTNYSNMPGNITISEMPGTQAQLTCAGIKLQAFLDGNANGVKDNNENGFALGQFIYEANNSGNEHYITSPSGSYGIYNENLASQYDLSYELFPQYAAYYNVTTPSYQNVQVQPGGLIQTYYFPVTVTQPYSDLAVHIIPNSSPRPGFMYHNTIFYGNTGSQAVSGTLHFTKDPAVTVSVISQAGTVATTAGFDYNFTNLQPFETRFINVTMQVPVMPQVNLGDNLVTTATIQPVAGDVTPANNTSSNTQVVVGSYDPNDKMESRGERIQINDFSQDDYLYYTIRFQNTGTAAAELVRIQDVLNIQLDRNTVEMIRASHSFTMDRLGNTLTWTFNDIMLPASIHNEPASHGYVYFKIKPLPGFNVGDIIPNTAAIYFDFNPAIITNTVNTQFVSTLGTKDLAAGGFTMYPNPARTLVNLQLGNTTENIKSVRVYDVTGKTLYNKQNVSAGTHAIDVAPFGSGAYFVEIVTTGNIRSVKKLLVN